MKPLATETLEPYETLYAEKIAARFKETLEKYYGSGQKKRMFHPKIHGLLRAEFIVPDNLSEHLQEGLFAQPSTYQAWVRLSNAKRKPQADKKRDMRGLAIKLMGVPGKKLLEGQEDANTHDFLLVTAPTLQTKSVKDFQRAIYALTGGFFALFWYAITHPAVIFRSMRQISKCSNLLEKDYFSMTPYLFGEGKAVKYAAFPQKPPETPFPKKKSDHDFLRGQLAKDIQTQPAYFDLMVQRQTDVEAMPIENPTKKWDAPFEKVATLKILPQEFRKDSQMAYAEKLSFTPWHCLPEHRPLGGANRARKLVYQEIAAFRNGGKLPDEPTELKKF